MKDPYEILGVARTATEAEIRSAYRKLAKQHHPDLNPGKPEAERRFKEVSAAHDLLGDAAKRARFDRGEIDASGAERQPQGGFHRAAAGRARGAGSRRADVFDDLDLESFFAEALRAQGGQDARRRGRGADTQYVLEIGFLDAAGGAVKRIAMPDGKTLDVRIPAGVEDGQVLRLKGRGMPGAGDKAMAGDALILIRVTPHPALRREGNDVILELPVTIKEAILGARIDVPTPKGPVTLTIPANSSGATRLRLKGRGIAGGDLYVVLTPVLPRSAEPELAAFLATWTPRDASDPRAAIRADHDAA
jgi:DnaJ-class molecular chaperone